MFAEFKKSILTRLALIQVLTIISAASFSLFYAYTSYKRESEVLLQKYIEQVLPKMERLYDTLISYKLTGLDKAYENEIQELKKSYPIKSITVISMAEVKETESNCYIYKPTVINKDLPKILICFDKSIISKSIPILKNTVIVVIGFSILYILIAIYSVYFIYSAVLRPLTLFKQALAHTKNSGSLKINNIVSQGEIQEFIITASNLWSRSSKLEVEAQMTTLARQVAHDIRSPLSALNMVSFTLDQIPEDRRLLIRNAIQRINDIANTLLQKSKTGENRNEPSTDLRSDGNDEIKLKIELLPALMDTIVSEKRVQFRNIVDVNIDIDLASSYGAFVNVDSSSFKRVMSNLINNSVEAFFNQSGKVLIKVKNEKDLVLVIISDNGKGIPSEIIKKLGEMGVSHGKTGTQSGSGLGLYHAKKTIEAFSGKIQIDSMQNQGTTITISIPKASAPDWFVEALVIDPDTRIISVDDDLSIHGIWKGRASSLGVGAHGIEHLSFTSGDNFKKWYFEDQQNQIKLMSVKRHNLFLMDYELLNQSQTGIDLIEELNIVDKAILITSRYEEEKIQDRCRHLGLKLIPKTMAGFIPIKITT